MLCFVSEILRTVIFVYCCLAEVSAFLQRWEEDLCLLYFRSLLVLRLVLGSWFLMEFRWNAVRPPEVLKSKGH